jgi:hypothetical protein
MSADTIHPGLEERVRLLEHALRRARRLALALGALVGLLAAAAWRAEDKVETRTLVLTGPTGLPAAVLRAGPAAEGASLVLETPTGAAVMTLGGPAARLVR